MDKVVKVCDVCEDLTRPVLIYDVSSRDGRKADPPPTLCAEHSAPLEKFLPQAAKPRRPVAKKAVARGKAGRTLTPDQL